MAVVISKKDLNSEICKKIDDGLWIKFDNYDGSELPFHAYSVNKEDVSVNLPFAYGLENFPDIVNKNRDEGKKPDALKPFKFTGTLREEQKPIIDEALFYLNEDDTCHLNIYCGIGKTVMSSYIISELNQGSPGYNIIVVPLVMLINQWKETLKNETTAVEKEHFFITTIGTIKKLKPEVLHNCNILVLDESHLMCTQIRLRELLNIRPKKILSLTATPEKDNGSEVLMELVAGKNRIRRISEKPFHIIGFYTHCTPPIFKMGSKLDWVRTINWVLDNDERDDKIVEWVVKNPQHKICIITNRVEHVSKLVSKIKEAGESSIDFLAGKKSKYTNCHILVGVNQKIGTGFDEAKVCQNFDGHNIDLLLLVAGGKKIEQQVGRSFRSTKPVIVHFIDGGYLFNKHWEICKEWYDERKGVISQTSLITQV